MESTQVCKECGNYYEKQILEVDGQRQEVDGYSTDNYTNWACDYIRGEHRDRSKPWYLWLCYGAIHGPSTPADRHRGKYKSESVAAPQDIFGPRPGKPDYLNKTQAWFRDADGVARMGKSGEKFGDDSNKAARTHASFVRQMNECVPAIDEGIGKLMEELRATNQLENTIIIYTADQGFSMGEHGFRTKLAPYDANYRSTLIVSWPGHFAENAVSQHAMTAPDLVVTFFAQAGIELPWPMHGHDMSALLKNPANSSWSHPALYEHFGHEYGSDIQHVLESGGDASHDNVPWYVAVRDPQYKYIHYFGGEMREELYDLKADPEELQNLLATQTQGATDQVAIKKIHAEMKANLRKELEHRDASFLSKSLKD